MTNFIEESIIINHLTSPQNFNNPQQHQFNLNSVSIHQTPHNSLDYSKIVENDNIEKVVNPMSSLSHLSSDHLSKENSDPELKQVLTEINDSQRFSQENLQELQMCQETQIKQNQLNSMSELQQQQIDKHKQIIMKKNCQFNFVNSFNSYLNQNYQKPSSPINHIQKHQIQSQYTNLDQDLLENLKEIYKFYSKLPITTNKYQTFEKLQQLSHTMILQKFMIFCKDFNLIDLEISNDLISLLGGKINNLPKKQINYNYKNNNKSNFILTKFYLVQIYKQNADKNMQLNFQNFIILIQKLADQLFPLQDYLLHEFLNLKYPRIYRRKMALIGKPFNSREQSEIMTLEKLNERKNILPQKYKRRSESTKKQEDIYHLQFPKISRKTNTFQCYSPLEDKQQNEGSNSLQIEDLNDQKQNLDPRRLFVDNKNYDEYSPQHYQYFKEQQNKQIKLSDQINFSKIYKGQQVSLQSNILGSHHKCDKQINNSRNQLEISQNMMVSGITRLTNLKSFDNQDNITKKSPSYSPQHRELCNLEKQYKIRQGFVNQQSCREKQVKKTKF
ncbi:unnamed protein product [Paramecium sonneborni]|uniref:Uncharacterized protein n=1 Tax=Paramecium sonneborni TaxID=65129 RepID=A0A8S1QSI9_9CILI|nr:unnamed protein product [Paramecium sonneborni]